MFVLLLQLCIQNDKRPVTHLTIISENEGSPCLKSAVVPSLACEGQHGATGYPDWWELQR